MEKNANKQSVYLIIPVREIGKYNTVVHKLLCKITSS